MCVTFYTNVQKPSTSFNIPTFSWYIKLFNMERPIPPPVMHIHNPFFVFFRTKVTLPRTASKRPSVRQFHFPS